MKKSFILLSALAVAAIASCVKEQPVDVKEETKGVPFEFTASTVDTKTTNDGMVTSWKADDKINLFHAEASTTDYSSNDEFTITSENLAAKKFTGTLASALDPSKSYDWYALYPYNAGFTTPANTTYEMNLSGKDRTQTGYNSTAHLGGLPLVGFADNVAASDKPAITMNNMMAVVKVVVTNTKDEPLTVTGVSITAPRKIVGGFIVDFSDPSNPTYSDGTYSYNTAKLKVNSGTALAKNESASFYIPIKPIALAADDHLIIKVNTQEKDRVMPSAFSFTPGKITTINFDYDKTFTPANYVLASSITAGDKVIIASSKANGAAKVMGYYSSGNNIPAVAGTVSNEIITSTSAMGVYTVGGNSTTGYTFYDADNELYLNATSAKSNYLKGVAETDEYDKWAVTITSGVAEILNKGKGKTAYRIRYNSTSDLFSAYTSAQTSVYIFKLTTKTPVTLSFANDVVNKTTATYDEFTGQTATASPDVTPITYAITGDAIGTVTAATGAVSLNGSTGTATVTATFAGNDSYLPSSASYTITVASAGAIYYRKVTEAPTDWSGTYLLVNEANSAAFNGEYNGTTGAKDASVTIASSKIESNATVDAYAVTIAKSGDHYSIKHGTKYIGWAADNKAQPYDDTSTNNALNDFAIDGGAAIIKSAANNSRIMRYNPSVTSANGRIRYYTTSTGTVMVLYKKD